MNDSKRQHLWMAALVMSIACAAGGAPGTAAAASNADIDRMTSYAVVLGRATGCQLDVTDGYSRVGRWMDRTFPPGTEDQKTFLPIFMNGVKYHAQQQAAGRSPDSCSTVRRTLSGFPWP